MRRFVKVDPGNWKLTSNFPRGAGFLSKQIGCGIMIEGVEAVIVVQYMGMQSQHVSWCITVCEIDSPIKIQRGTFRASFHDVPKQLDRVLNLQMSNLLSDWLPHSLPPHEPSGIKTNSVMVARSSFKYGKETTKSVEILSPDEKQVFGKIRRKGNAEFWSAYAVDGQLLGGGLTTKAIAAQTVAKWGYDHISRGGARG